ncbi:hypothetical protein ACROYT_G014891 [Oculina patagonica]
MTHHQLGRTNDPPENHPPTNDPPLKDLPPENPPSFVDKCTQTLTCEEIKYMEEAKTKLEDKQELKREIFMDDVLKSNKSVHFYTGLPSHACLMMLFSFLKPLAHAMKYWDNRKKGKGKHVRTPIQNRGRPQAEFSFSSSSEKSPSKSPARKKTVLTVDETSVGQEAQRSQFETKDSHPTSRRRLLSPGERFIKEKCRAIEEKLAKAAEKRKVLEDQNRRIKEASSRNNLTGQRCSNCHYKNHTVCSCQMEKCKSAFFCGEITRHPDEKMKLQEQKNKIKALETSATKLEQELRSREAAFDRVHGSVNKQLEDMLLEEYPEEYVQNKSRNWLKIQQDIAFVKKSLRPVDPLDEKL